MTDREFRECAERILWNLALERTGWHRFFRRWYISSEPLRNDASRLLQDAGVQRLRPLHTKLVGGI